MDPIGQLPEHVAEQLRIAAWAEYMARRDDVRYWGACCWECVYGPEDHEEGPALELYERTGRMESR